MKKLSLLSLLCLSLCFTSCFELVEQISMNEDGSGEMTVTLNLYESKDKLQQFMEMEDGMAGYKPPERKEMDKFFKSVVETVSAVEGISDVKSDIYYEDFIFSISASYEDIKAMNQAINNFTSGMSRGMMNFKNEYTYQDGVFKRIFQSPVSVEDYSKIPIVQRIILESARIVNVYRFEKPVKNMSSTSAELSHDAKEARFESSLSDIAKGVKSPANEIEF